MLDGLTKPPSLPTRCICRRDGSKTYEVWCEWCEAIHRHDHIDDGALPARCDQAGGSPYLKTGYRAKVVVHTAESFAAGAFPTGAAVGKAIGIRKFQTAFRFSAVTHTRGLLRAIFPNARRSLIFSETIQNTRISVDETNWNALDDAGNFCEGSDLLSLMAKVFAITAGVAVVRIIEQMTGAKFDDRGRIEIAAAVNSAVDRAAPKSKARAL